MKLIYMFLLVIFALSCSSKEVSVYEKTKLIQIKCKIGDGTLDTFNDEYSQPAHGELYSTPFFFSIDEQKRLMEEVEKVDFMSLPDTLKPQQIVEDELERLNFLVTKSQCEIYYNGQLKKVYCSDEDASIYNTEEYKRYEPVFLMISKILWSRPEVKELPRNIHY